MSRTGDASRTCRVRAAVGAVSLVLLLALGAGSVLAAPAERGSGPHAVAGSACTHGSSPGCEARPRCASPAAALAGRDAPRANPVVPAAILAPAPRRGAPAACAARSGTGSGPATYLRTARLRL